MKNLNLVEKKIDLAKILKREIGCDHQAIQSVLNIFADCQSDGPDAMAKRCLNAVVDLDAGDLLDVAKRAIPDGYNGFKAQKLVKIMEVLLSDRNDELPEDPSEIRKSAKDFQFKFGRESSPVLYIKSRFRFWADDITALVKASGADEVSVEADGSIRLWWD
jgi:hypothetical protein